MKLILFNGPLASDRLAEEHLGLSSLAAVAQTAADDVIVIDSPALGLGYDQSEAMILAEAATADVLGVTLYISSYRAALRIAERAKELNPGLVIIIGGHMANAWWKELLEDYQFIDAVILGEGEIPLTMLLEALQRGEDICTVQGVACRIGSDFKVSSLPPLVQELDTLPDAVRSSTRNLVEHLIPISIYGSRGCLGNCSFCSINSFYGQQEGPKLRTRSVSRILDEMETLSGRFSTNSFKFVDDNFLACGTAFIQEFIDEVRRRKLNFRIRISGRATDIIRYRDMLPDLKRCGLEVVSIGIENQVERVLKLYRKGTTPSQNLRALEILREEGIVALCGFILLDPFSVVEEIEHNLRFLRATFYTMTHPLHTKVFVHQGDPLQQELEAEGILYRKGYEWFYDFVNPATAEFDAALKIWSSQYNEHHYRIVDCLWTTRQLNQQDRQKITEAFYSIKEIELTLFEALVGLMKEGRIDALAEAVKEYSEANMPRVIDLAEHVQCLVNKNKKVISDKIH